MTYEPGEDGGPPNGKPGKPGKPDNPGKTGKPAAEDDDANKPPAEIAIVDMKTWRVIRSVTSGHETEGIAFSPDSDAMLVTNEGDDTVSVYHARTGQPIRTVKLTAGGRPRGITVSPDGKYYVVTLESLSKFVVLDAHDFSVVKTVDTKLGPYGITFGPEGQRLLVAAARDKTLQVFDGHSFEHVTDVPIGQRCWHFSFTPDGTKLMLACGRSDAVYVLDAKSYQPSSRSATCRLPGASSRGRAATARSTEDASRHQSSRVRHTREPVAPRMQGTHAPAAYFHAYRSPTHMPRGAPGPTNCSFTGFAPSNVWPGPLKKFSPSTP